VNTAIVGVINRDEAYSKAALISRLGISQRFWDKLLDDGLPYTIVGHSRWITGEALLSHLSEHAERKAKHPLETMDHATQAGSR
jgi:hypothetical protein